MWYGDDTFDGFLIALRAEGPLPALTPPKHRYSFEQRCVSRYHDV